MDSTLFQFEDGHGVSALEAPFRLLPEQQLMLGYVTPVVFLKPMLNLDATVQQFVISNKLLSAVEVFTKIDEELKKKGFDEQGQMNVEVDEEDPSWKTLVIEFKISGIPYTDLLTVWEDFVEKYYTPLDEQVKDKVRLLFEPT